MPADTLLMKLKPACRSGKGTLHQRQKRVGQLSALRESPMNDSSAEDRMQRYSEIIIEHSQFPHHHGSIDTPTHQGRGENPFCGDRITLQLLVDDEGKIQQAAVESVGCAISMASASLLATHLHGLNALELLVHLR
jgi:hypothetical protein